MPSFRLWRYNPQFRLQKNDWIYIFSDGYADQFSPQYKTMMKKNFRKFIVSLSHKGHLKQQAEVGAFFDSWKSTMKQTDDVLLMGVQVMK